MHESDIGSTRNQGVYALQGQMNQTLEIRRAIIKTVTGTHLHVLVTLCLLG